MELLWIYLLLFNVWAANCSKLDGVDVGGKKCILIHVPHILCAPDPSQVTVVPCYECTAISQFKNLPPFSQGSSSILELYGQRGQCETACDPLQIGKTVPNQPQTDCKQLFTDFLPEIQGQQAPNETELDPKEDLGDPKDNSKIVILHEYPAKSTENKDKIENVPIISTEPASATVNTTTPSAIEVIKSSQDETQIEIPSNASAVSPVSLLKGDIVFHPPPIVSPPCLPKAPPIVSPPCLPKAPPIVSPPCLPKAPPIVSPPCLPTAPPIASPPCLPKVPPIVSPTCLPKYVPDVPSETRYQSNPKPSTSYETQCYPPVTVNPRYFYELYSPYEPDLSYPISEYSAVYPPAPYGQLPPGPWHPRCGCSHPHAPYVSNYNLVELPHCKRGISDKLFSPQTNPNSDNNTTKAQPLVQQPSSGLHHSPPTSYNSKSYIQKNDLKPYPISGHPQTNIPNNGHSSIYYTPSNGQSSNYFLPGNSQPSIFYKQDSANMPSSIPNHAENRRSPANNLPGNYQPKNSISTLPDPYNNQSSIFKLPDNPQSTISNIPGNDQSSIYKLANVKASISNLPDNHKSLSPSLPDNSQSSISSPPETPQSAISNLPNNRQSSISNLPENRHPSFISLLDQPSYIPDDGYAKPSD